jgi:hypothetical protein
MGMTRRSTSLCLILVESSLMMRTHEFLSSHLLAKIFQAQYYAMNTIHGAIDQTDRNSLHNLAIAHTPWWFIPQLLGARRRIRRP